MKKLLGLLFIVFLFVGCGEDKDHEPLDLQSGGTVYFEYLERYYHLDDIESFNKESVSGVMGTDITWFYGVKNGKRWMGMFDEHSKNLLKEWKGADTVSETKRMSFDSQKFKKIGTDIVFLISNDAEFGSYSNLLFRLTNNNRLEEILLPKHLKLDIQILDKDRFLGYCKKENNQINDMTNILSLNNGKILINNINEMTFENEKQMFISGFQGEKVWFALCNNDYSLLQEWNGVEQFDRNKKYHLEYEEYEEYYVDEIFVNKEQLLVTDWGYAFTPSYRTSQGESRQSDIFLLNDGRIYYYPLKLNWSNYLHIRNWYNGSVLADNKVVLSPEGELIAQLDDVDGTDEAVSYDETICFERWTYEFIRHNYGKNESVWQTKIDKLDNIQSDAKVTMIVSEKNEQIWKYRCDIVNRDGSKTQFSFQLNIETGELIYL